jgi:hypothetical protein
MQYSVRDLYPNLAPVITTGEMTVPEGEEQKAIVTKPADGGSPAEMVTHTDKWNLLIAFGIIVGVLFLVGIVK